MHHPSCPSTQPPDLGTTQSFFFPRQHAFPARAQGVLSHIFNHFLYSSATHRRYEGNEAISSVWLMKRSMTGCSQTKQGTGVKIFSPSTSIYHRIIFAANRRKDML